MGRIIKNEYHLEVKNEKKSESAILSANSRDSSLGQVKQLDINKNFGKETKWQDLLTFNGDNRNQVDVFFSFISSIMVGFQEKTLELQYYREHY